MATSYAQAQTQMVPALSAVPAISTAWLIERLARQAVNQRLILEVGTPASALEVLLTRQADGSVLIAAQGDQRTFRSLEALTMFLHTVCGAKLVQKELKA